MARSLIEGAPLAARWGRVDVTPHPLVPVLGELSGRISIFPPGATGGERALLSARAFVLSWLGVTVAAMLVGIALAVSGVWMVGVVVAVLLLAAGVAVVAAASPVQGRVLTVRVLFRVGHRVEVREAGLSRFLAVASRLDGLRALEDDPVLYELEWGRIYWEARVERDAVA